MSDTKSPVGATATAPAAQAVAAVPAAQDANSEILKQIREMMKQAILKGDFEIPLLPHVSTEVMKLANDPNKGIMDLEKVVKQDQVIAAKVIKVANSPFYRGVSEITSLSQAMSRIGVKSIKDIVLSLGIQSKAFNIEGFVAVLDKVWDHSVAAAAISEMLTKDMGGDKESAFLAGLIHDIGKPIIVQVLAKLEEKEKVKAAEEAKKSGKPFNPKEFQIPGLRGTIMQQAFTDYHEIVGSSVAARWNLPETIIEVVKFHHHPEKASEKAKKLCTIVNIANKLCHHFGYGHDAEPTDLVNYPAFKVFNLAPEEINLIAKDTPRTVEQILGFL